MRHLIFAFFLMMPANVLAESYIPRITVSGMAKKEVVPDEMNWNLSVQHKAKDLESLASEHASSTSEILRILKDLGVEQKTLKASQMRFSENWEYLNQNRIKTGYVASTSIAFTLKDFSRYLRVWQKLSQYREVSIGGVSYSRSDYEEIEQEIKNQALLNAKAKALKMADTLAVKLGQIIYIGDNSSPSSPPMQFTEGAMLGRAQVASDSGPVEPGVIEIRSDVRLDYQIVGE